MIGPDFAVWFVLTTSYPDRIETRARPVTSLAECLQKRLRLKLYAPAYGTVRADLQVRTEEAPRHIIECVTIKPRAADHGILETKRPTSWLDPAAWRP